MTPCVCACVCASWEIFLGVACRYTGIPAPWLTPGGGAGFQHCRDHHKVPALSVYDWRIVGP